MSIAAPATPQPQYLRPGAEGFLVIGGRRHKVTVRGISSNAVSVTFAGIGYPAEGVGVDLEFPTETGCVTYHTRVLHPQLHAGEGLVLERSESVEERTHRSSWRVPTDFVVVVKRPAQEQKHTAVMRNLSAGGMLIASYADFAMGEELVVTLELDGKVRHHVRTRVVFAEELPVIPGRPNRRHGLAFVELPPEANRAVTWYLWKRVRELYPEEVRALYPRRYS